jgi:hypothetical protein
MAQTTDAATMRNAHVELSMDGSTWIDVSGSSSAVDADAGDRKVHEITPLFVDAVVVAAGARGRSKVTLKTVYTETEGEAYLTMLSAYESKTPVTLRWNPKGTAPGVMRFKMENAVVAKATYPSGGFSEAKPITAAFELTAQEIKRDIQP